MRPRGAPAGHTERVVWVRSRGGAGGQAGRGQVTHAHTHTHTYEVNHTQNSPPCVVVPPEGRRGRCNNVVTSTNGCRCWRTHAHSFALPGRVRTHEMARMADGANAGAEASVLRPNCIQLVGVVRCAVGGDSWGGGLSPSCMAWHRRFPGRLKSFASRCTRRIGVPIQRTPWCSGHLERRKRTRRNSDAHRGPAARWSSHFDIDGGIPLLPSCVRPQSRPQHIAKFQKLLLHAHPRAVVPECARNCWASFKPAQSC